jgi:dTDP-3-amino-3,6-dideoxy-alpha-D-glucopyranose N,N-dimethyltransferase/dTDP-3-amino-3,4,6-trideoxy-alpha-D-glucopyranose N,N-dimethyltransferase/N-methyltransferase
MTSSRSSQFYGELAKYYDGLNGWKDYRAEVLRLEAIARRSGRPGATAWLDVACGTGRHLEFLRRRHPVVGVDGSRKMLRVARRRLPGVRLVVGDMRTFRLQQRFDVVSCLFSAIGHLESERDLRVTFANFARHLNPGGVVIVEPWVDPSKFRPAMVHVRTFDGPTVKVARVAFSSRRGNRSVIQYHFLIGRAGRGVRHVAVTDVGLLVSRARLVELMAAAGLRSRFLARGLMPGRGLLVGTKSR